MGILMDRFMWEEGVGDGEVASGGGGEEEGAIAAGFCWLSPWNVPPIACVDALPAHCSIEITQHDDNVPFIIGLSADLAEVLIEGPCNIITSPLRW
jgi:hypothetical protein